MNAAARGETGTAELIQALQRPESYPHETHDLRWHETHISFIVLVGSYAYKLKKPLNLGFLDFSTLQARTEACQEELRLNRRLCKGVYLRLAYLIQRNGRLFVASQGPGIEPLVMMRRLPEEGMLPRLLARGAVDRRVIARIARRLARFHATVPTGPGVDEFGALTQVRRNWEDNFSQASPFVGKTLDPSVQQRLQVAVDALLRSRRPLFEQRVADGRVREGHGDVHAGSICVEGRRIHIFDCIEFNKRFRCNDVAAEVAFLAMDLDRHGRSDLSALFVDAYVADSGDGQLLELIDFYKCYRAFVRGKVTSIQAEQPGLDQQSRAQIASGAQAYFDLAHSYAQRW